MKASAKAYQPGKASPDTHNVIATLRVDLPILDNAIVLRQADVRIAGIDVETAIDRAEQAAAALTIADANEGFFADAKDLAKLELSRDAVVGTLNVVGQDRQDHRHRQDSRRRGQRARYRRERRRRQLLDPDRPAEVAHGHGPATGGQPRPSSAT